MVMVWVFFIAAIILWKNNANNVTDNEKYESGKENVCLWPELLIFSINIYPFSSYAQTNVSA